VTGRHSERRARARRHTPAGLAWRQFAADPWVSAALALLVGLVSLLVTAVPRALEDVQTRQLAQDVGSLSAMQRDVTGSWGTTVESPTVADEDGQPLDPWQAFEDGAEQVRLAQPEPLRSLLGPAQMHSFLTRDIDTVPPLESSYYAATVTVHADPRLEDHVELVDGAWPELGQAFVPDIERPRGAGAGGDLEVVDRPVQVVVLDQAAEELHWEVGDDIGGGLELAGTYRPLDPADPRWQHVDNGTRMGILADPNRGEAGQVTAYVNPLNRGSLGQPASVRTEVWYPVDPARVTTGRVDTTRLRQQLTRMLAQQHVLVPAGDPSLGALEGAQIPAFTTELTGALDQVARQQRATSSLLAVVAAGPLGVAAAVTALGARLVVQRRRSALAMTLARGASPTQLRRLVAAEGLVLGVPAALLGHAVARLVLPGPARWWEWAATAAVAFVPALALAGSLDDASLLQQRSDLSARGRSRWRWVVEAAVLGLAGLATWRLLDRDSRGDAAAESGIDLLAAAAPLLLALAACVVALRLYPLPLAAVTRVLRRRPSLTPFLGAARALRDPAGGLVPALSVVLGTSIALVSAVLLTTVTNGAQTAAWQGNGAAVRLTGPVVDDALVERIGQVDGVTAVTRVRDLGSRVDLAVGGERQSLRLLIADDGLEQVMAPPSQAAGPPAAFYAQDGPVPVVTGGDVAIVSGEGSLGVLRDPVRVVGHLEELPGLPTPGSWALVDSTRWEAAGRTTPLARMALVAVGGDADPQRVAEDVRGLIGSGVVTTVQEELDGFTSAPVTTGLTRAFVGAALVSGVLTVLAIVVVQLMGAGARTRLLAVLRTLGLAPRQTRALTSWELGPLLLTSLVVGTVLGLAVPWVLVRAVDLRGLTGGRSQPLLSIDLVTVGGVLLAVVLTVLLAVSVSAWLAGRTNLAQSLRVGEER
jgi:putative ABC transport system permease protein